MRTRGHFLKRRAPKGINAEQCRQLGKDCLWNSDEVEAFIAIHQQGDGRLIALNTRTMKKEVITDERWLERLLFTFCMHRRYQATK